jgi:hypothetical protein
MAVVGVPAVPSFLWSDEQRSIIEAPVIARLLVEAGPGTGKTAVACGRVAWLLDQAGVLGHEILLISFTRTATAELRDRIADLSRTQEGARSVRLSTIDSHAWSLRQGCEAREAKLLGGDLTFDVNIERALKLLQDRDADALEFLSSLRHVLIDEAQDVVGQRAEFIVALLDALAFECGITAFADPAQAIYGWASEKDEDEEANSSQRPCELLDLVKNGRGDLKPRALTHVYRTDNPALLAMLHRSRRVVLKHGLLPRERYEGARGEIESFANGAPEYASKALESAPNSLVLCRRRIEVLQQSRFVSGPFRLRLPGLPICVEPWIGHLLSEETGASLTRSAFDGLWQSRYLPALFESTRDDSWSLLRTLAPDGPDRLSLRALRRLLARPKPPIEVCTPDVGKHGPILGTIHASKGREADSVILALPYDSKNAETNWDEESRVLYVAVTRARHELAIAKGAHSYPPRPLASGRIYEPKKASDRVHIGMAGDVDETAHVMWEDAARVQRRLAKLADDPQRLYAYAEKSWGWRYRLYLVDPDSKVLNQGPLGQLSEGFNADLWRLARLRPYGPLKPGFSIPDIRMVAVRTVSLGDDYDARVQLPYRDSKLFLAPVVHGFPIVFFPKWNGHT